MLRKPVKKREPRSWTVQGVKYVLPDECYHEEPFPELEEASKVLKKIASKKFKLPFSQLRPEYHEKLHNFVKEQLDYVNDGDTKPCWGRVMVYRNAMQHLMEAFTTYKPLLSAIQQEYDRHFFHYKQIIRKLEPANELAWTVLQDSDQRLMKVRQDQVMSRHNLIQQQIDIQSEIEKQHAHQKNLVHQIEKLKSSLEAESDLRREEAESKRLLLYQLMELRAELQALSAPEDEKKDKKDLEPELLLAYLKDVRETLRKSTQTVIDLESRYCNVVDRKEFDELTEHHQTTLGEVKQQYKVLYELKNKYDVLRKQCYVLQKQRNYLSKKVLDSAGQHPTVGTTLAESHAIIIQFLPQWKKAVDEGATVEDLENDMCADIQFAAQNPDTISASPPNLPETFSVDEQEFSQGSIPLPQEGLVRLNQYEVLRIAKDVMDVIISHPHSYEDILNKSQSDAPLNSRNDSARTTPNDVETVMNGLKGDIKLMLDQSPRGMLEEEMEAKDPEEVVTSVSIQ